jgi:hypothetical protein
MLSTIDPQGITMDHIIYLVALASVSILAFLYYRREHDPKEPPLISPRIPIIGHALGIIRYGVPYYTKHRWRRKQPILQALSRTNFFQYPLPLTISVHDGFASEQGLHRKLAFFGGSRTKKPSRHLF